MAQSKITLIGLEQFLNPDHSVFESLELPEGIDKDTLIGSIMLRCQEFELLYTDPDVMTSAVFIWGKKNYWTFDKWVKLINKQYDPLYNKDYYEDITDNHEGEFSNEGSAHSSGNTGTTNNLETTHSERAYNNSTLTAISKDADTGTVTGTFGNNNTSDNSGNDSYENTRSYHGYGNIGITSAQELFLREAKDVATWNMYEHIADLFASEFCIMVY